MSAWATLLDVLCTILPIITFASPATVFLSVFKSSSSREDVIEMPPLAVTTQMLQCYLFAIYAHHLQMWTLFIPNTVGFLLGFIWSTMYPLKVTSDPGFRLQWQIQYTISLLVMLMGSLTIQRMPHLSSTIAAAVGVLMCTYPLPSMRRAYKENNANLMGSAFMNFTMLTTCFVWVVHSSPIVEYDVFVLVSNAAGVVVQGSACVMRAIIMRRTRLDHEENAQVSALTPLL
jgi:hypothetical protein